VTYNLGDADTAIDYTAVWNPVECTTTNAVVTYGDGSNNDATKKLNTDGYLVQDAANNKFTIKSTTPLTKAGTYSFKVTWKSLVNSYTISSTNGANTMTVTLTLVDNCKANKPTWTAVAD
jgi:hypothetical protein